jgi:hypothetical protein
MSGEIGFGKIATVCGGNQSIGIYRDIKLLNSAAADPRRSRAKDCIRSNTLREAHANLPGRVHAQCGSART